MARLIGQFERQLVTALLLLGLLMSWGVVGRAQQARGPEEPAATAEEPTATVAPAPAETPGTPAAAAVLATPPTAASTPTRLPPTSPLVTHRLITYYGHPASDRMGILGEYEDTDEMVAKLKEQAAAYTAADPSRPALCTIELIASVAQNVPGNDNLWLIRTPKAVIERYSQLAEKHGCLLLLDIQIGYDTVENELESLLPFLRRPYVHLAIDPEFRVKPGQVPGEHYGSVTAAEVAYAGKVLGDLVRGHNLPDKVLVVHQFRDDMLPDKEKIAPMPNVDLVLMMDGWGTLESKVANYEYFVRDQPIQYGGIKLFYRQDEPLMTPQQVIELTPTPLVVIYQ